jgi:hypothetical protein
MRQVSLIALVSVLALFIGGCPAGDDGQQAVEGTPSPTPAASPVPPKTSPTAKPFANPLTAKQPGNPTAVAGLIPSLPPEERVKQIPKGRNDPFAGIPLQPEVTVSPNQEGGGETNTRPVPQVIPLPGRRPAPNLRRGTTRNGTNGRNRGAIAAAPPVPGLPQFPVPPKGNVSPPSPPSPGATARLPSSPPLPGPNFIPQLPKLPEPTLAKGIEVTGVVEVGGVPTAIVKVPNEPGRYVREGERLSNGQVLVKRIDMNRGSTPVVILEQYGQEVARGVGEKPAGAPTGEAGSPTASLPIPTAVNAKVPTQA